NPTCRMSGRAFPKLGFAPGGIVGSIPSSSGGLPRPPRQDRPRKKGTENPRGGSMEVTVRTRLTASLAVLASLAFACTRANAHPLTTRFSGDGVRGRVVNFLPQGTPEVVPGKIPTRVAAEPKPERLDRETILVALLFALPPPSMIPPGNSPPPGDTPPPV